LSEVRAQLREFVSNKPRIPLGVGQVVPQ
jgi:hypothetical protein